MYKLILCLLLPLACGTFYFECDNGECILGDRCNGFAECSDSSDEIGCCESGLICFGGWGYLELIPLDSVALRKQKKIISSTCWQYVSGKYFRVRPDSCSTLMLTMQNG